MAYEEEINELLEDPDESEIAEFFLENLDTEGSEMNRYWESLGSFLEHYWCYDEELAKKILDLAVQELKTIRDDFTVKVTQEKVVVREYRELVHKG